MIRRIVLSAIALVVIGGSVTPAVADVVSSAAQDGGHGFCIGLGGSNGSRPDSLCLWIPTS